MGTLARRCCVLIVAVLGVVSLTVAPVQAAVAGVNPIDVTTPPTSGVNWQIGDLIRWEAGMTGSDPVSGVLVATITPECGVKVQRSTLNLSGIAQIGRGSFRTLTSPGRYTLGIEYQAVYGDPAMFESQQLITIVGAGIDACGVEWDASGPVGPAPGPAPVTEAAAATPAHPQIRQGVHVPSGGCVAVDPDIHAWGTGLKGDWRLGWEKWHNEDGSLRYEGWACIRTIHFNTSRWEITHD